MTAYNASARQHKGEAPREEILDIISIDGRRVARTIDSRTEYTGLVYEPKSASLSIPWWAWLFRAKIKMLHLGLLHPLYLGADGHVYREYVAKNGMLYFKRAQIHKRKTLAGIKRVHEAILRLE